MKKITYLTPKNSIPYNQLINRDFDAYGYYIDVDRSKPFATLCEYTSDRDLILEIIPTGSSTIILRTEYSVSDERVNKAIQAIDNEFATETHDMSNPLFWGFSSKNELSEYLQKNKDCFYSNFLKSIAKNSPEFMMNSQEIQRYEIGKSIIEEKPNLIFNSNQRKLLLRINANFRDKVLNLVSGESANRIAWCIREHQENEETYEDIPF
jgi:hypothetical protein